MFTDKKAWFSRSVPQELVALWLSEGGLTASWTSGDYLFSTDASCWDTRRIYESVDYVRNKLTVFHSSYLSACKSRQSIESIALGHYVLPPVPVQKEIKAVAGGFIWEQINVSNTVQNEVEQHGEKRREARHNVSRIAPLPNELCLCCNAPRYPVNNTVTGFISIEELDKYSGRLQDFIPGCAGSLVTKSACTF